MREKGKGKLTGMRVVNSPNYPDPPYSYEVRYDGGPTTHKYGAKRTDCASGHSHPSKAEAKRCNDLAMLERCKLISELMQQPKFPCVVAGVKICTYVADFSYRDERGELIIEDVKGQPTPVYRLKKKLVEALYPNVKIMEVRT